MKALVKMDLYRNYYSTPAISVDIPSIHTTQNIIFTFLFRLGHYVVHQNILRFVHSGHNITQLLDYLIDSW